MKEPWQPWIDFLWWLIFLAAILCIAPDLAQLFK